MTWREAGRSQYGFCCEVNDKTGEMSYGFTSNLRDALPNASFIGFTGTRIEQNAANTRAVFGEYVSVDNIQQAVIDKATAPIYYESRIAKPSRRSWCWSRQKRCAKIGRCSRLQIAYTARD